MVFRTALRFRLVVKEVLLLMLLFMLVLLMLLLLLLAIGAHDADLMPGKA